jgi:hypothetical protein
MKVIVPEDEGVGASPLFVVRELDGDEGDKGDEGDGGGHGTSHDLLCAAVTVPLDPGMLGWLGCLSAIAWNCYPAPHLNTSATRERFPSTMSLA